MDPEKTIIGVNADKIFTEFFVTCEELKRENEMLRCDLHGVCSACAHGDEGFEAEACKECGDSCRNWKWRGDVQEACVTQKPLSWENAEACFESGEVLFVERYATDKITVQTEPETPDAIAFLRKTLYGLGVNDGIVCGFRYWRVCPTEAERAAADWTRI